MPSMIYAIYLVGITAFGFWLCFFGEQLSPAALLSLIGCVVGGFTVLIFRHRTGQQRFELESVWVKILFFVAVIVLLDCLRSHLAWSELSFQAGIVAYVALRLLGKS